MGRSVADIAADPGVREIYAYFNNHARGQAVRNAEMFEDMLREAFPPEAVVHAPERSDAGMALELPFDAPDPA